MAIREHTRKLLWSRSGGRCAICRCAVTEPSTPHDRDAVIGDECHIRAQRPGGPRHDPAFPGDLHGLENLLILCPTDHRKIDEQPGAYPVDTLIDMKRNHERWVEAKLDDANRPAPSFRITRPEEGVPLRLTTSGRELWALLDGSMALWHDVPEVESAEEARILGMFVQNLSDIADVASMIEPGHKIEMQFELRQQLLGLLDAGYVVYAGRTKMNLGGVDHQGNTVNEQWPAVTVVVRRLDEAVEATAPVDATEPPTAP